MPVSDFKKLPIPDMGKTGLAPAGLSRLIPNIMTLVAIGAGLSAIQFAWEQKWEHAVLAILIAVIMDTMDGATARLLKAQSDFGAQLDSLSDFLAFGVAPAIILHAWILEQSGPIGWIAMIVYAAATALRLARFNATQKEIPAWKKGFFSGIPSPAGAGMALLPLIIWIQSPHFFEQFAFASPLAALWTLFVAGLMVSRLPTYSTKMIKIPSTMGMPIMIGTALLLAALVHTPWLTLTILCVCYMATLPFAVRHFQRLQKQNQDEEDLTNLALGAGPLEDTGSRDKDGA
jgi:CDP-diacylglycerol---serine O-phosphatidyltransferase